MLIATGELDSFRCCFGMCENGSDGSVAVDEITARTLEIGVGDDVWSVPR